MEKQTHFWIEDKDGKSGFVFWQIFMRELFPEIKVESKKNNSELVKAVKNIADEDRYIIVMDNSFDNPEVYLEQSRLKKYSAGKNVIRIHLICFEYLLLEFSELLDWIYADEDDFRSSRKAAIDARNILVSILSNGNWNYKQAEALRTYDQNIEKRNIEQLSAKLLFDLTRNTGFEVTKGKIGDCWIKDCCEWDRRQEDDICGLENSGLDTVEKMKAVYKGTSLKSELKKAGLEVAL